MWRYQVNKFHNFLALYFVTLLTLVVGASAFGQQTGVLQGHVRHVDTKTGVPGANLRLQGTVRGGATDEQGFYKIEGIPSGPYVVIVTAIGHASINREVTIGEGTVAEQDFLLSDEAVEMRDVMVYGASLRAERITDAPAAVSVIDARQIARNASSGQFARLIETEPGMDIVQNGLYDININTRGFNSSLNRRVLILLDGRDFGTAFLGAPEWNGLSIPIEEMGRIELVKGPGSALYGANAYNGVINITSISPRTNPGTRVLIGGGEHGTARADIRHAGVKDNWSYRLNAGGISGKTLSTPRTNYAFEYDSLFSQPFFHNELRALNTGAITQAYTSLRIDYDYDTGGGATVEGGISQVENEVYVTGIGRVQSTKAQKPWIRMNYRGHGFNVLLWSHSRINIEPEYSLSTGLPLTQNANISQGEVQYAFQTLDDMMFVVAGASIRFVDIDTRGSLMASPRKDNMSGVFAQAEYRFSDRLKTVVAVRLDKSTLHSSQVSPKAAVVWTPMEGHTLRGTFNQAFQSPNYSELYLRVIRPRAPGATSGVAYLGNPDLIPEKVTGYEVGYKGILFDHSLYLTVDGYFNHLKDFVTDLGDGLNPKYPVATTLPGDTLISTIWSYTNAGEVNEMGVDIAANIYITSQFIADASVSLFDFDIVSKHKNDVLLPNSPDWRVGLGLTYNHPEGHDVSVKLKHVPTYAWAAGIYRGHILSYSVVNVAGTFKYSASIAINASLSNALDSRHYEIFGGSLQSRRGVVTVLYTF
ncbi:MAG: hypothetical protein A3H45_03205 [Ignavibacteria bacterium RIFCSPLOWO2_02_FULL_55_14]|nr:MAG: hypothetical protein A3H45_03205 [Ignavibacteria bacterium RIFCSPLOWO2_02_FULL_55_14]